MRKAQILLVLVLVLGVAALSFAVPILQVGVPNGLEGYVPYTTDGEDKDTAFTSGNPFTIVVAGAFGPNTVYLGGNYNTGPDWGTFQGSSSNFNGHEAILLVSVPESAPDDLSSYNGFTISIDGGSSITAFYFDTINSYFPNNHYPVQSDVSDFLFFDIGSFSGNETVVDFSNNSGSARGEIKNISVNITGLSLDWVHFDVMALETTEKGGEKKTTLVTTTLENNPASHDVTWTGGGPPQAIPEPATMMLVGSGFVGLGWRLRRKSKR
uniref:PEP-CTERM sorting domain-containing protein n=1 Tax=Desulfacinum infernum TaxID=35837 RepID=A0A832A0R8_9BACT